MGLRPCNNLIRPRRVHEAVRVEAFGLQPLQGFDLLVGGCNLVQREIELRGVFVVLCREALLLCRHLNAVMLTLGTSLENVRLGCQMQLKDKGS